MTHTKFYKEQDAVLDYSLDWTDFLTDGDTLTASEWIAPSGITVASGVFGTTFTTTWISGGTATIEYDIINHITTAYGREDYRTLSIFVVEQPNELYHLIGDLRLHLGDLTPGSYRYTDEWLTVALESSIKALQRWWGDRYTFDHTSTGLYVMRSPDATFTADSPPEIEDRDARPIILMASILVKSGQLEANSWAVGSWKDAEIAVSNIEGSRSKQFGINLDWEELKYYLKPPSQRLFGGNRISPPDEEEWEN